MITNGNVQHNGGSLKVDTLYAAGAFSRSDPAFQSSNGDVLFGGDITNMGGPGSVIGGNLSSGGSIQFLTPASTRVAGNVTAAHNVSQPFPFSEIDGNLIAGGDVNIQGKVLGNVQYGGTYTAGASAMVGGSVSHGGAVTPTPYIPLSLPPGRNLAAGSGNIALSNFETRTILPGAYGALAFASSNTVNLSAGQYVFSDITSTFSLNKLNFDTSAGPINIYIANPNYHFNLAQYVNGQWVSLGTPNPFDSTKIFLESPGSITIDSNFWGTVFAPSGDITVSTLESVTGQLLASGDVTLGDSDVTLIPEPASLGCLGVALMISRRRKRIGLRLLCVGQ